MYKQNKEGEEDLLRGMLPANYSYKFVSHSIGQHSSEDIKFDLEVRVNVHDENNVKLFLSELNDSLGCTFNVQSGR